MKSKAYKIDPCEDEIRRIYRDSFLRAGRLSKRAFEEMPREWFDRDLHQPLEERKEKVTLYLDRSTLKVLRESANWQERVRLVLRASIRAQGIKLFE